MVVHAPTNPRGTESTAIAEGENESNTTTDRSQAGYHCTSVAVLPWPSDAWRLFRSSSSRLSIYPLRACITMRSTKPPPPSLTWGRGHRSARRLSFAGKPLMTMTYSGAIKPAVLYGLYLRFTGS